MYWRGILVPPCDRNWNWNWNWNWRSGIGIGIGIVSSGIGIGIGIVKSENAGIGIGIGIEKLELTPALLGIMPGDTCHPRRKNPRNKRPLQSRGEATSTQSKWSVLGHHQRRILCHGWRNEWGFTAKPVQPSNTFKKWYRSTYIM